LLDADLLDADLLGAGLLDGDFAFDEPDPDPDLPELDPREFFDGPHVLMVHITVPTPAT
jgi:hypothetical protein